MKGIFHLKLALPRQFTKWDPDIVLDYLNNLEYDLPLVFYCACHLDKEAKL